jgi:SAM-dependent methyltransferase
MSDESDNESAPIPPGPPPGVDDSISVLVDVEPLAQVSEEVAEAALVDDSLEPVRRSPPPKPRSRPPLPSVPPPSSASPSPPAVGGGPPAHSNSPPPSAVHDALPVSIKPMRMIKLGADPVRAAPPPSSLDRLSRPPAAPAVSFDPPTEPRVALEPPAEPELAFDPPTLPIAIGVYEGADEDVTPTAPHVSVRAVPSSPPLPPQRSKPPPPPSARAALGSAPQIRLVGTPEIDSSSPDISLSLEDVSEMEAEERISVSEVADGEGDGPRGAPEDSLREPEKKKPPPPPKRGKEPGAAPSVPSDQAVQSALEPSKFEQPSIKPRTKPWWEELFTDDFGRGIMPLTPTQVTREVDFIEESLGVAKGGVVLDLACGTGHHAVDLAGRGYGVVGFDLSLPQLAVAGEYAQERGQKINFLQGDMRDMSFDEVFDGIYCWNTSFGYFEEERNVAVAERVFKALRPGGSFLLDVVNRDFVVEQQPSQVWFEGDACVCMDDMSVDFITSRLRVKRTMMLDDGRTRECAFSIRVYSLHELGKLLHDIGFRVTEASGHPTYPGVFFGATSPRVVILAQKP